MLMEILFGLLISTSLECFAASSPETKLSRQPLRKPTRISDDELIKGFISNIKQDNLLNAYNTYLKFGKELQIKAIRTAFSSRGDITTILLFTEWLPTLRLRTHALSALVTEIRSANLPDAPSADDVSTVDDYIKDKYDIIINSAATGSADKNAFETLIEELDKAKGDAVSAWAKELLRYRSGYSSGFYNILDFSREHESSVRYFELLVDSAFQQMEEDDVFYAFLYLANELSNVDHAATVIIRLYTNMKDSVLLTHEFTQQMAKIMVRLIGISNYRNAGLKDSLNADLNDMPESVRGIARGDKLCVRNAGSTSGFLNVKEFNDQKQNAILFNGSNSNMEWIFEEKKKLTYEIKSVDNDYLYADDIETSGENKLVFTWKTKSKSSEYKEQWQVQNYNFTSNKYYIYNVPENGYLNVDTSDRAILTATSANSQSNEDGGLGDVNAVWLIQYCTFT